MIPNQDEQQVYAWQIYVAMTLSINAPILYKIVQGELLLRINIKNTILYMRYYTMPELPPIT